METIEDVSELFFTDATSEETAKKKFLTENYTPRQIGSLVKYVEPVNGNSSLSHVLNLFESDKHLNAIPVEENDRVIGMIDRVSVEYATNSAIKRMTTKSVINYVTIYTDTIMLDASDFLERDLQKITDISRNYSISDFPVFDNKNFSRSFLGIANLNDILSRIAEIRERDLKKAAIVQTGQFPTKEYLSSLPYKVVAWNRMANPIGGDIYQAMRINDTESFVALFDVSGKNVSAAMLSMSVASFFKISDNNQHFSNKPSSFVSMLDKYLATVIPDGSFITGVLCYFNTIQNVIYIFNCGHTISYLFFCTAEGTIKTATITPMLPPFGMGIISEKLSKKYENTERPYTVIKYQPKIHINLYSDGLTDMYNKQFEVFGDDKAKNFFISLYTEEGNDIEKKMCQTVNNFTDDTVIPDDITIVDIRL